MPASNAAFSARLLRASPSPLAQRSPAALVATAFTFGPREATAAAARFGLGALYERNKGATGITLLVDADTAEIICTLTMNFSEGAIRSAIARAIAIASHTDDVAGAAPGAANWRPRQCAPAASILLAQSRILSQHHFVPRGVPPVAI